MIWDSNSFENKYYMKITGHKTNTISKLIKIPIVNPPLLCTLPMFPLELKTTLNFHINLTFIFWFKIGV